MALLLNIDTSVEHASVCLAKNGQSLAMMQNDTPADHAGWLQPAIEQLAKQTGISLHELDAVAVSNGPGSYTGLRVGLSTAKGLCYALQKSLIIAGTLEVMASSAKAFTNGLLCPMIDARRMEVYTAIYNNDGTELMQPVAMILDTQSFAATLAVNHILFFGNGSDKFRALCNHPHASFATVKTDASHLAVLSNHKFYTETFADIAYSEPMYCKEFYSATKKLI